MLIHSLNEPINLRTKSEEDTFKNFRNKITMKRRKFKIYNNVQGVFS